MYYSHPEADEAYDRKATQYMFGEDMLIAPITEALGIVRTVKPALRARSISVSAVSGSAGADGTAGALGRLLL